MPQKLRPRLLLLSLSFCTALLGHSDLIVDERSEFVTEINGESSPFAIRSVLVRPGEEVRISAEGGFRLQTPAGNSIQENETNWVWVAPTKPGAYRLELVPPANSSAVIVNAFVVVPYEKMKKGRIKGYKIGTYPRGEGAYARPVGFIEVTRDMMDVFVSPNFQLKQFLCRQNAGFPKYLVLREKLLTKLEMILEKVREEGSTAETLRIASAYRTPAHNRGHARNSRHLWGDAADVFVDADMDGRMDDLNNDGRQDLQDAEYFGELVDALESDSAGFFPVGGFGLYPNHRHSNFVHVDARGIPARWVGKPKKRRISARKAGRKSRRT